MKVGDLIQDRAHPEDIAIVLESAEAAFNDIRLFWIAGSTAGDVTLEGRKFVLKDFVVLSSAKSASENFNQK